jgi:hypothetical protein
MKQIELKNAKMQSYTFLAEMYDDDYFPNFLVDKGKQILIDFCEAIEAEKLETLRDLYILSHAATEKFNDLEEDFEENDSEIETAARECIANDFYVIAQSYGFEAADIEELIAPRIW